METVRAKFVVDSIERRIGMVPIREEDGKQVWGNGEVATVKMHPVYGGGDPEHENTKFWHATPSGHLELGMVNEAAVRQFALGREFYVDFTPAE